MHINDIQYQKLRALGYTGALVDMLDAYRRDNEVTNWYQWYAVNGYTKAQYNDRQRAFWAGL